MPGGPRGLQNRRRFVLRVEVGSIPTLSASFIEQIEGSQKSDTDLAQKNVASSNETATRAARQKLKLIKVPCCGRSRFAGPPGSPPGLGLRQSSGALAARVKRTTGESWSRAPVRSMQKR